MSKAQRTYLCLPAQEFTCNEYRLTPIRDEDKYVIAGWRNEQIDILRQKEKLTNDKQELYFKNVVEKLFYEKQPDQLLFSFFEKNTLIGYGGLVHIDWESKNAEISFITATERNIDLAQFADDWNAYLKIIKQIASVHLRFNKIYTYAYDIRSYLFEILTANNFLQEAHLKDHIAIKDELHDVLIHSFFLETVILRVARMDDVHLLFNWANEKEVRENSFNHHSIEFEQHEKWLINKLEDPDSIIFIASSKEKDVGQIRFDKSGPNYFEVDFSIDKNFRGRGLGTILLKTGVSELNKKKPGTKKVIGKVKNENISSRKSFLKAGFKLMESIAGNTDFSIYYFDTE